MDDHKGGRLVPVEETEAEKTHRHLEEVRMRADMDKRQYKYEEYMRLAVPKAIEALRKEAAEKIVEAEKLEAMLKAYPNLRKKEGRWKKIAYYSKDVNALVDRFDRRFNCGCCVDSPLEIWPYLETPIGNIYSDPSDFRVGEKESHYGGTVPHKGWDKTMRAAGIPESIIGAVGMIFTRDAAEAKRAAEELYAEERDPNSDADEPPV